MKCCALERLASNSANLLGYCPIEENPKEWERISLSNFSRVLVLVGARLARGARARLRARKAWYRTDVSLGILKMRLQLQASRDEVNIAIVSSAVKQLTVTRR